MGHGKTRKDIILHESSTGWHGLAENLGRSFTLDEVFARNAFRFRVGLADIAMRVPGECSGGELEAHIEALAERFEIDLKAPSEQLTHLEWRLFGELARYVPVPEDKYSLRLDDDGSWVRYGHPVTEGYTHFSQQDAYAALSELEKELGGAVKLSSAGTLFQGARCWVQMDLVGQEYEIRTRLGTVFPHKPRVTNMWGHDGRTGWTMMGHSTDIVCWNTSEFALGEGGARITIPHKRNIHDAVAVAIKVVAAAPAAITETRQIMQHLADTECTEAEFRAFAEALVLGVDAEDPHEREELVAIELQKRTPISEGGEAKTTRALSLFEAQVEEYVEEFRRRAYGDGHREPGSGLTYYAADSAISARIDHPTRCQDALAAVQAAGGAEAYVRAAKGRYQEAVSTINKLSRAAESSMLGAGAAVKRRARQMLVRAAR